MSPQRGDASIAASFGCSSPDVVACRQRHIHVVGADEVGDASGNFLQ